MTYIVLPACVRACVRACGCLRVCGGGNISAFIYVCFLISKTSANIIIYLLEQTVYELIQLFPKFSFFNFSFQDTLGLQIPSFALTKSAILRRLRVIIGTWSGGKLKTYSVSYVITF